MNVQPTIKKIRKGSKKTPITLSLPTWQQLTYAKLVLNKKELLYVRVCIGIIALSFIILGTRFYLGHRTVVPAIGGHYREGVVGSPTYVNPILATQGTVDSDLSKLLFRGLLKQNNEGKLVPDLAKNISVSDDHKIYTVTLTNDALWHDGEKITIDDVIFTFQSITDAEWQSPYASGFTGVEVEKKDDTSVTMRLKKPFAPFESLLTMGIIPSHVWSLVPPSSYRLNEQNTKPIGSGPYKFESLTKDKTGHVKSYLLTRFEDYGKDKKNTGPYLDSLEIEFYPSDDDAMQALTEGNVDALAVTTNNGIKPRNKSNEIPLFLPRYTALFFNTTHNNLKNKIMRQALTQGIDTSRALSQTFKELEIAKPIHSPILEGSLGYDASLTGYMYSPTSSSALISSLGWNLVDETLKSTSTATTTDKKIRKKGNDTLRFTITTIDRNNNVELAHAIKDQWARIGIESTVEVVDPTQFIRDVIRGRDFDMVLFGGIYGQDPDYFPFWHSTQTKDPGLNISLYQNSKVDALLDQARIELDESKRIMIYKDFQTILLSDAPAVFLYEPIGTYILPSNIKGVKLEGVRSLSSRFDTINEWYSSTERILKLFN